MTCLLSLIVRDLYILNGKGGESSIVIDGREYTVNSQKKYSYFGKKLKSINIELIPNDSRKGKTKRS
jgi:hypothetical protein